VLARERFAIDDDAQHELDGGAYVLHETHRGERQTSGSMRKPEKGEGGYDPGKNQQQIRAGIQIQKHQLTAH